MLPRGASLLSLGLLLLPCAAKASSSFWTRAAPFGVSKGVAGHPIPLDISDESFDAMGDVPDDPFLVKMLLSQLRAGGQRKYYESDEYDSDGEYDEEYDDDEEEEMLAPARRSGPDYRPQGPNQRRPYDHRMMKSPSPRDAPQKERLPPLPKPKKRKNSSLPARFATQSLSLTSRAVGATVSTTGKLAYNLIRPKKVSPGEVAGLWRLDQQLHKPPESSVATIRMDARRRTATVGDSDDGVPYTFDGTFAGSFRTEFVAPAFAAGRLYGYRGTWQRKLTNPKILKLVGKIYKVKRPGRFSTSKKDFIWGEAVGTFVARRRIEMKRTMFDQQEGEDEYDDDEGDQYDDGNDEDGEENFEKEKLSRSRTRDIVRSEVKQSRRKDSKTPRRNRQKYERDEYEEDDLDDEYDYDP